MLLVGIDWAERHHDVGLMAVDGRVLARERITDRVAGVARLHELIASWAEEPTEVVVGIETDRGLLVGALVAAGYRVVAVNPLAASRYRKRHTISRAKSDRGDARTLADLVRTDRHHHRPAKGDSGLVEAVKVLARGHQQLVWARQRQGNIVRSVLRAFYPAALAAFGGDPGGRDADTLEVPQQVQVALTYPPYDHRPGGHHLDGASPPEPDGRPGPFTLLAGVLLSDQPSDDMGNLWVWPGTHLSHEGFFREHGPEALVACGGYPPIPLPTPEQVGGRAGDLLLAHYLLGHNIGGNTSDTVRRAVYFRLKQVGHAAHWRQFLQDAWLDYDGVRGMLA